MGISVKLICPTRAWAYLHFVNIPTFKDKNDNFAENSEIILAVGSVCNLEQPADSGDAPSDGRH